MAKLRISPDISNHLGLRLVIISQSKKVNNCFKIHIIMKALSINFWGQTKNWWIVLIVGILLVLGGFAYWFWPAAGFAVASQIFGWLLVLVGIVQLCVAAGVNRPRRWGCKIGHPLRNRLPVFPCDCIHLLGHSLDYRISIRTS